MVSICDKFPGMKLGIRAQKVALRLAGWAGQNSSEPLCVADLSQIDRLVGLVLCISI